MRRIISFSGGKDSTALILYAIEEFGKDNFEVVFCDTGWELDETYDYINYINTTLLGGKLIIIKSDKYSGFVDLSIKKQRVPSSQARFCTEELKLMPMKKYIAQFLPALYSEDNPPGIEIFIGVREEESKSRVGLPLRAWAEYYNCFLNRPLLYMKHSDIFGYHRKYGIKINPAYKKGKKRVGCRFCIELSLPEIREVIIRDTSLIDEVRVIEAKIGRSFFPPSKIPERYHTGFDDKSKKSFPWIDDVVKYLSEGKYEIGEEEGKSCMSYYSICE